MVQLAVGATFAPLTQVLAEDTVKSDAFVPLTVALLVNVSVDEPLLLIISVCGALVTESAPLPNTTPDGENDTACPFAGSAVRSRRPMSWSSRFVMLSVPSKCGNKRGGEWLPLRELCWV